MIRPWTTDECAALRDAPSLAEAQRRLPHRSRAAVRDMAQRLAIRWGRASRMPRAPRTVDERRFAVLAGHLPPHADVAHVLAVLSRVDWRQLADDLAERDRRPAGDPR